ncbi:MAG TPA: M15 family metallopeptidase [Clostridia bacterium]|nr:M15 family metallopeptidase [Clostridia bacterium]
MNDKKKPLPAGFCYADECVFTCLTDAKYASADNFTGRIVKGYNAPKVVLSVSVADAFKRAAEVFLRKGLLMKFYDAYRPQRAVDAFDAWALDTSDILKKETHYPHIEKEDLFKLGYIARRSGHTRGCAVDLTLAKKETLCELDMGTHFDFMDPLSWHGAKGLTEEQNKNRTLLMDTMLTCGFRINPMEWWHYALIEEPFPDTYFDFEIGTES